MFKTAVTAGSCLLLVGVTVWGLIEVVYRPFLYLPTRAQPYGTSLFLVLPRFNSGGYSLAKDTDGILKPFPDKMAHVQGVIRSAVDIHLDSTGLLWVLDSGHIDTLKAPVKLNDARVLAIDADTGKVNRIVSFKGLIKGRAQYLCVDEDIKGARYLYVSDGIGRSIVVWDVRADQGHRVLLPERVMPNSVHSKVLYAAFVKNKLYFTYFGSFELYSITAEGLLSEGRVVRVGRKDPRMIFLGVDRKSIIFRLAGKNEALSWDTTTPLTEENLELIDVGGDGFNQMAAVPNFGKLWILDSEVKTFLEGKQPKHRFRPANITRIHPSVDNTDLPEIKAV